MDKGYKTGLTRVAVETSGYAVQEFKLVEASDVDNISYFTENIEVSIKTILSYDINRRLIKTECFTYGASASDHTKIKNTYCIWDDENFKGIFKGNTEPSTRIKGQWYYVEGAKTINSESYLDEILGCLVYGEADSLRWAKCKIGSDGKLIKK